MADKNEYFVRTEDPTRILIKSGVTGEYAPFPAADYIEQLVGPDESLNPYRKVDVVKSEDYLLELYSPTTYEELAKGLRSRYAS